MTTTATITSADTTKSVNTTLSATSASPSTTSTGGGDSSSGSNEELSQESTFTNLNEILRETEALSYRPRQKLHLIIVQLGEIKGSLT